MPNTNDDLSRLPRILIKGVPKGFGSFGEVGVAFAKADPLLNIAGRFGAVADKLFMETDLCLINLTRKVEECLAAHARASWFGGRIFNKFSDANTQYAEVPGAVIAGTLLYLEEDVPDQLDRGRDYLLRRDYAQECLLRMKEKARSEGRIK